VRAAAASPILPDMRKTTGSMICPSCGKLISVSEEKCPFCGSWNPSFYGYAPALQSVFGRRLDVIQMISVACVALYIAALVLQPEAIFQFRGLFDILAPGSRALWQLGMTGGLAWQQGWWWTVLTAIYLHGSLLHIFFNLMWVRQLGPSVTEVYGPARGFILFSIAGAVGFIVSNVFAHTPTVGASGSIFGLIAAMIVYGRRSGHSMMTQQLWTYAAIMFVMGFFMGSVNNWAHAGGFAGGYATAMLMPSRDQRRETLPESLAAIGLLAATAAGFVLSFVKVTGILIQR